jgi:hypothetical protein
MCRERFRCLFGLPVSEIILREEGKTISKTKIRMKTRHQRGIASFASLIIGPLGEVSRIVGEIQIRQLDPIRRVAVFVRKALGGIVGQELVDASLLGPGTERQAGKDEEGDAAHHGAKASKAQVSGAVSGVHIVRKLYHATLALVGLIAHVPCLHAKTQSDWERGIWRIERHWLDADERQFGEFIGKLGESSERTTDLLLHGAGNVFRGRNPSKKIRFYADCADLPYILRAYYAYMNNLPFSWIDSLRSEGGRGDIRYSRNGNRPRGRRVVKDGERLSTILREISGAVSSGTFRMNPRQKGTLYKGTLFPDHYSPKVDRRSIRPGTVVYDPNGHVAIIYRIDANGRIFLMDAHPDNSITRIVYGEKFSRSRPETGAGFKSWRPVKFSDDFQSVTGVQNAQLSDYDLVQFFGTDPDPNSWKRGKFVRNGGELGYYDYVRTALAKGNLRYDPVDEFSSMLQALMEDARDRQRAVEEALYRKIHRRAHPARLPGNIYGTHGDWESYSTPARDARLKTAFRELRTTLERFVEMAKGDSPRLAYDGEAADLGRDLLRVYEEEAGKVVVKYRRTSGGWVELNLEEIEERLFRLSFDPYHGPELRWGAVGTESLLSTGKVPARAEVSSLKDSGEKIKWYVLEQRLRNQIDRSYEANTAFTLRDLSRGRPLKGNGVPEPPVIEIREFLESVARG